MDYDLAYANADFIPNATAYPPRWAREAEEFRAARKDHTRLGLSYGDTPREAFDLFLPDGDPRGLVVFVHGGYWLAFGREDWSGFAAGPVARGWAVAMPSYPLAPKARLRDITRAVARAVARAAREVEGPVVLAGHSAGGHLVARMNCSDALLPEVAARRLRRIVAISPLADLRPLTHTRMNADLRLDAAEAQAESPVLGTPRHEIATLVWVGAEERPAFLDQAIWLTEAWDEARLHIAPGRHHFDVLDPLKYAESPMVDALLAD
ncbi:alpha/beta hydrolase [Sinisalibacter aestuarii]|uniref:Esterase n=1 Tax=Sinisalibacter aestuarii TaxID=2949426 RepID=A0ABQ5LUB4_9RHOB|nr:alpha/beta hydrolase [Sinisalibacter aestuarii]GKY88218.1 esterase [Sinisalibacter aestuarii]